VVYFFLKAHHVASLQPPVPGATIELRNP